MIMSSLLSFIECGGGIEVDLIRVKQCKDGGYRPLLGLLKGSNL